MPFDVDVVRGDRRELGAGRQQRREMKDEADLEFREQAIEQVGVGDRPGEDPRHERHERGVERVDVERDDGGTGGGQPRDQTVPDLAARARDQRNRFAHPRITAASYATGKPRQHQGMRSRRLGIRNGGPAARSRSDWLAGGVSILASSPHVCGSWHTSVFR